eukprot:483335-Hanusia_phi.AAC.1
MCQCVDNNPHLPPWNGKRRCGLHQLGRNVKEERAGAMNLDYQVRMSPQARLRKCQEICFSRTNP